MPGVAEVPLIARRRIEAELIRYVYGVLEEEFGTGKARELVSRAVERAAEDAGSALAAQEAGAPGTRTLAARQGLWSAGGALETRVLELTDDVYAYEVTRCDYADMYRELGMADLGSLISCLRDAAFVRGYAPDLSLERDGTIMEGCAKCRFLYRRAAPPAGPGE
ncbi:MAG: L-2-amino-thiazoline-4-carboxylic acid hydrolase [Deltaproteobacteria bacterium]|jgi:hypothetical protein|nr:L-2-amino-thiazoline-4-carboxylic acid hydrolase [Deltaproteobacteria bacterium]